VCDKNISLTRTYQYLLRPCHRVELNSLMRRKSRKTNRRTQPEKLMSVVLADRLRAKEGQPLRDHLRACLMLAGPDAVL
jgi:hypothetical protein